MKKRDFPLFWYCGRRGMKGDKDFIKDCLFRIPEHLVDEVCKEYDKLYLSSGNQGRKNANEFLFAYAEENGIPVSTARKITSESGKERAKEIIIRLKQAQRESKPRIKI